MNIFQGRRSLQSVTQCSGPVPRLLGVLHFSKKEGIRNSPGVQELFWEKVVQDNKNMNSVQLHDRLLENEIYDRVMTFPFLQLYTLQYSVMNLDLTCKVFSLIFICWTISYILKPTWAYHCTLKLSLTLFRKTHQAEQNLNQKGCQNE